MVYQANYVIFRSSLVVFVFESVASTASLSSSSSSSSADRDPRQPGFVPVHIVIELFYISTSRFSPVNPPTPFRNVSSKIDLILWFTRTQMVLRGFSKGSLDVLQIN